MKGIDMLVLPSRRQVLQGGAALVLAFRVGADAMAQTATAPGSQPNGLQPGGAPPGAWQPNAWLAVHPDGAVQLSIVFTELGQGTETGVAMITASICGSLISSVASLHVFTPG